MNIILHIGTLKAGSTSIQFHCINNREQLLQHGVLFPRTGLEYNLYRQGRSAGHNSYIAALKNDDSAIFDELREEIADQRNIHTVLLSSENYSTEIKNSLVSKFKVFLGEKYDYRIVVYLRRQDHFLESIYGELVSGGWYKLRLSAEEFLREYLDEKGEFQCDYTLLLQPWDQTFGRRNVVVRPFEKIQWKEGDFLKDFFTSVGLDELGELKCSERKKYNISVPPETNQIIRYLNQIPLESKFYRAALNNFFDSGEPNFSSPQKLGQHVTPPALRERLLSIYRKSNEHVAVEYLHRPSGELFFEPEPRQDELWQPVRIQDPDSVARLFSLYIQQKSMEVDENFQLRDRRLAQGSEENESIRKELATYRKNSWKSIELQGNSLKQIREAFDSQSGSLKQLRRLLATVEDEQKQHISELRKLRKTYWKNFKKQNEFLHFKHKESQSTQELLYRNALLLFRRARLSKWHRFKRIFFALWVNEVKLIQKSGLIDAHFYFKQNPGVISTGMAAAEHYVRYGAAEGKDPSSKFSTRQYLAENIDAALDGINPLAHYILSRKS